MRGDEDGKYVSVEREVKKAAILVGGVKEMASRISSMLEKTFCHAIG